MTHRSKETSERESTSWAKDSGIRLSRETIDFRRPCPVLWCWRVRLSGRDKHELDLKEQEQRDKFSQYHKQGLVRSKALQLMKEVKD